MNKISKISLAIVISTFFLIFFIKDILYFLKSINITQINLFLIILASLFYLLNFLFRSLRFSIILNKEHFNTFKIFSISQFLSTILPLRLGDLYLAKLKDENTHYNKIIKTYIYVKILDFFAIIPMIILIFCIIKFKILLLPITIYIIYLILFPIFIYKILYKKLIIKIKKIDLNIFENNKYIVWILTNINWFSANIYSILLINSINKLYPLTNLEVLFSNLSMILGGMMPIPSIGGYGILEIIWTAGSRIIGVENLNHSFSIAFFTHTFALILGFLLYLSIIINLNINFKNIYKK